MTGSDVLTLIAYIGVLLLIGTGITLGIIGA